MLRSLQINNIALIKELTVGFDNGLIVLSGETGAGKSIIIDSINFILGGKADKTLVKHGESKAVVSALFEVDKKQVAILSEYDIECEDGTILLERSITIDGKNDCRINGRLSSQTILKNVASGLVNLHGQHEHQTLLKTANHIKMIDAYGGQNIDKLKSDFASILSGLKNCDLEIQRLGGSKEERERGIDILKYQINEIKEAKINENEEIELLNKRATAQNLSRITEYCGTAIRLLNDDRSGESLAVKSARARQSLLSVCQYDPKLSTVADRLKSVQIELDDIAETLGDFLESVSISPSEIDKIESRLDLYKELKRKYGKSIDDIHKFCIESEIRLAKLENSAELLVKLSAERSSIFKNLVDAGKRLTQKRRQISDELSKLVLAELDELGMQGSKFLIEFSQCDYSESCLTSNGFDRLEFFFSANSGEPPKPLKQVISGGEMSRFMLAFKVVTGNLDGIDTMIFDEIDTGISGKISTVVAMKLAKISRQKQVVCVTHLPAIAAMADQNCLVVKKSEKNKTSTSIIVLNEKQVIEEISRLVGDSEVSKHSLSHSEELKNWSNNYKHKLNV